MSHLKTNKKRKIFPVIRCYKYHISICFMPHFTLKLVELTVNRIIFFQNNNEWIIRRSVHRTYNHIPHKTKMLIV